MADALDAHPVTPNTSAATLHTTSTAPHTPHVVDSESDEEDDTDSDAPVENRSRRCPELPDVRICERIGRGTFSVVYKGYLNNEVFAYKRLTKNCGEARIRNEGVLLDFLGGKAHVVIF
jgi:hypothetical protein